MSGGRPLSSPQKKELDTMKESISDIINQLQDIDPSRLSFSPFLDLDTQITLAPVSDSPESSVEELHSPCASASGSTPSLEPPPANHKSLPRNYQRPINNNTLTKGPPFSGPPSEPPRSPPVSPAPADAPLSENCTSTPRQDALPNGTDPPRWSPETPTLVDESTRPLISPAPESVELSVWSPQDPALREACPAVVEVGGQDEDVVAAGGCCRCKCCRSGRVPAFLSVLASLLCAVALMYALYFHVPLRSPRINDVTSRLVFTLCCCALASVPVLLAMLVGSLCQFCSGSLGVADSWSSRRSLQQLFVSSSLELLLLYVINLLIMAALLPPDQLLLVPTLAVMFVLGRLVYWVSLNVCSPWRGFGSGLTVFPLLACVALNLFLMYNTLNAKQSLFGS